jgi:hypothetical protein
MAARTGEGAVEGPNLTLDEARAAAESRGVDTSRINLKYQPPDDPFYADKYGFSRFRAGLSPDDLTDEELRLDIGRDTELRDFYRIRVRRSVLERSGWSK